MSSRLRLTLMLLLAAAGAYGGYSFWRAWRNANQPSLQGRLHGITGSRSADETDRSADEAETPSRLAPTGFAVEPFTLTERSGKPFDSRSLQGNVWVASFFFTNCSGACLKLNNSISRLQTELAGQGVRFVSISVDPENDTPERLREYAAHYKADAENWLFLTGDEEAIGKVAEDGFRVPFALTLHSDRLIAVDRQGRVQGYFSGTDPTQIVLLKKKVRKLLDAGS